MEGQTDAPPSPFHQAKFGLPFLPSSSSLNSSLNLCDHPSPHPRSQLRALTPSGQEGDRCLRFPTRRAPALCWVHLGGARGMCTLWSQRGRRNEESELPEMWLLTKVSGLECAERGSHRERLTRTVKPRVCPAASCWARGTAGAPLCPPQAPFSPFPRSPCPAASSKCLAFGPQKPFATLCFSRLLLPAPHPPPSWSWLLFRRIRPTPDQQGSSNSGYDSPCWELLMAETARHPEQRGHLETVSLHESF